MVAGVENDDEFYFSLRSPPAILLMPRRMRARSGTPAENMQLSHEKIQFVQKCQCEERKPKMHVVPGNDMHSGA